MLHRIDVQVVRKNSLRVALNFPAQLRQKIFLSLITVYCINQPGYRRKIILAIDNLLCGILSQMGSQSWDSKHGTGKINKPNFRLIFILPLENDFSRHGEGTIQP